MVKAQMFLKASGKPTFTPVTRVKQGQKIHNSEWDRAFTPAAVDMAGQVCICLAHGAV